MNKPTEVADSIPTLQVQKPVASSRFPLRLPERRALLLVTDFVLINAAVLFALWVWAVRGQMAFSREYVLSQAEWFLLSVLWVVAAALSNFYDLKVAASLAASGRALLFITALVFVAYLVIYFFSPPQSLPRGVVLYHGTAAFVLVGLWRAAYALLIGRPPFHRRALIVGAGWAGRTIAGVVQEYLSPHYELLGFVDDDPAKQGKTIEIRNSKFEIRNPESAIRNPQSPIPNPKSAIRNSQSQLPVLGTSHDLGRLVQTHGVVELILAITHDLSPGLFQALLDCQEQGIQITPMPVLYEEITGRVPVEHIGDNWYVALPLGHAATGSFYPLLKRALDIVVASVGLSLFVLLFPFVALALYLDSPGPLFYRQERVGKGGRVYTVVKLRTMVPDAERGDAVWAQKNDPRVTRVGRILRKTRLDEFPQFINILRREMSAVGPRPERPEFVAQLEKQIPFYRLRHAVKPGMAGWAMIHQHYAGTVEDALIRLQYDLYYIKHQSIWLDVLILLRTLGQMARLRGR